MTPTNEMKMNLSAGACCELDGALAMPDIVKDLPGIGDGDNEAHGFINHFNHFVDHQSTKHWIRLCLLSLTESWRQIAVSNLRRMRPDLGCPIITIFLIFLFVPFLDLLCCFYFCVSVVIGNVSYFTATHTHISIKFNRNNARTISNGERVANPQRR